MRRALIAVVALAVLAGGALGGVALALRTYDAPGPLMEGRAIVVPRGGLDELAEALEREGVVAGTLPLRAAALLTRGEGALRAGELEFPAHASLREVLAVLRTARPVQHRLTIPEGLTAAQVAVLLDAAPALDGAAPVPEEGRILPETYAYERGTTRAALLARARTAMDRALARAWADRDPAVPFVDPAEALILASIVERESGVPEERARIAAVYLNRLRLGMKLQSDPTVVYGASGGLGVLDHGLTRAELARDDPYNTYRIAGLPPGPICMPGLAAVQATLQPATTDALYFVADGTGGHAFARTLEEHNRNVARWRELERGRAVRPMSKR